MGCQANGGGLAKFLEALARLERLDRRPTFSDSIAFWFHAVSVTEDQMFA